MNIEDLPPEAVKTLSEFDRLAREGIPTSPPADVIADIVKLQRGMLGCSQQSLGALAGVSLSTMERIERGETVSNASLDQVAVALGYKVGDFTYPRVPLKFEELEAKLKESSTLLDVNKMVPVRRLSTQPQIAALARTHVYLLDGARLGETYQDDIAALREELDFLAYVLLSDEEAQPLSQMGHIKRGELYAMVLGSVREIEKKAKAVALGGTYQANTSSPVLPIADVALIGFFPRASDPAAYKRRFLLAPKKIDMAAAWHAFVAGDD